MEDLKNLSKTELIERLLATREPVANTEASELDSYKIMLESTQKDLDRLKEEHTKLVLKYGKKVFELLITEFQLEAIKSRNLWERIWNKI